MNRSHLVKLEGLGYTVDTKKGLVYGKRGRRIGVRNKHGYVEVRLGEGGVQRSFHAHRLVWEAAYGTILTGLVIHHRNGVKHDNRLANLQLTTQLENVREGYRQASGTEVVLKPSVRRAVLDTWGVVTAAEWAEDLGLTEAEVHGFRLANLRACVAFSRGRANA